MSPSAHSVLVGREPHLDRLRTDARRALEGESRATLLCGDAGIGKSRLLAEYLDRTPMGRTALGACLELGTEGIAYAPFTALLRHLLRAEDGVPETGSQLTRLLPGLGEDIGPDAGDNGRARLFEAVLTFLEERARPEGLALVVEDLHWSDASTRDLLVFLLRNLHTAPVHLVVSVRTDDLHRTHPLRPLLPELERLPRVTRMDLAPLTRPEVGRQAAALAGTALTETDLDLLHDRSGGNPLFVESFVGTAGDGGVPEGPRDLLMRRVEPLPETARRVLGLASVAGDRVDHALLAEVAERSGVEEDELDEALRHAVDAQVLRATETGYVFRHALLAEAVKADLLPGQRVRAHRRYAEVLDTDVPGLPRAETVAQLAHHAYAAHDHPRALAAAWEAAQGALAATAHPEHLELLERVLELWELVPDAAARLDLDRGALLLRVCLAAQVAGDLRRSVDHATDGLAELDPTIEPETEARLLVARARAYKDLGRLAALDDMRAAAGLLPKGHFEQASIGAATASVLMLQGNGAEAEKAARGAIDLARRVGDRASEADALVTLGSLLDVTGSDEALELLREGIRIGRELGEVQVELRGLNNMASNLALRLEYEEALEMGWRALDRCAELGILRSQGGGYANGIAIYLAALGRLEEAWRLLETHTVGEDLTATRRQGVASQLHLIQGDWAAAGRALDEFARLHPRDRGSATEYMVHYYSRLWLLMYGPGGRLAEAARLAFEGERDIGLIGQIRFSFSGLHAWAELVFRLRRRGEPGDAGLTEELAVLLRRTLEREDWPNSPAGVLNRQIALGWLAEDPTEALVHWERALPLAERASVVIRIDAWTGTFWALLALGDRERASGMLDSVRQLRGRLGPAVGYGDVAGMSAALAEAVPTSATPPAGLTPREAEVLTQVAKGLSNREVGEALFISAKTVSVHVTNLMAKLEVNNRTAAVARARELGLT
ncbi:AAA family ATPase [Nocardiopsis sp. NPDC006832]|uniref:ATP-binding protein n=1 Tax=Nocardiopsis sp. NPDC006832 TaxID=3157188 RepID=UPI0033EC64D0